MFVEAIGLTINIRERVAAAAPPRRNPRDFYTFVVDPATADAMLTRLHSFIDGKPPKQCALTILAAMQKGLLTQPTYKSLHDEFPEIGARTNYAYYLQRAQNYSADIAAIAANL